MSAHLTEVSFRLQIVESASGRDRDFFKDVYPRYVFRALCVSNPVSNLPILTSASFENEGDAPVQPTKGETRWRIRSRLCLASLMSKNSLADLPIPLEKFSSNPKLGCQHLIVSQPLAMHSRATLRSSWRAPELESGLRSSLLEPA